MISTLSFGTPLILMALIVLPAIWFLLRVTPPKPQHEPFPPLKILTHLLNQEQTAQKTPWWLVLLRLLLAGFVIIALSQPVVTPRSTQLDDKIPLVIMIDNGFASQPHWQDYIKNAKQLIFQARSQQLPITVIATAEPANSTIGPYSPAQALEIIDHLVVRPIPVDRLTAVERLETITSPYQLAYLNDGLATSGDEDALARLKSLNIPSFLWYTQTIDGLVGLTGLENGAETLRLDAIRGASDDEARYLVGAYDELGRRLGEAELLFAKGTYQAQGEFSLPLEMRNDIALLKMEDVHHAGATYLASSSDKRRRIAFLTRGEGDILQPLLSPFYYLNQALSPFGDLITPPQATSRSILDILLDANPAILVMIDEVNITVEGGKRLNQWLQSGGTLLRFAGLRLAAGGDNDAYLPVRLRHGERVMGGIMSWSTPQKIAPISRQSPLFGLEVPNNVTVNRQILAEPEPDLFDKSWVVLEDGTPLVTAQSRGQGRIILVHTTATPHWSNLVLSGFFVEMMQRFVFISQQPTLTDKDLSAQLNIPASLLPWRTLSPEGQLQSPPSFILPLNFMDKEKNHPDFNHFPGLYGSKESLVALNLLARDAIFAPLQPPTLSTLNVQNYQGNEHIPLDGFLWGAALILFTLDCLLMTLRGIGRYGNRAWQNV